MDDVRTSIPKKMLTVVLNLDDPDLQFIIDKLRWSAERGEWSVPLRPVECQHLLDAFGV